MSIPLQTPPETVHDETLIDWFLSLEPAQRLAELESRLAFFSAVRRDGNTELPADSVDLENADRLLAALNALEARYREHDPAIRPTREDILSGGRLLLMTSSGPLDVLGFIGRHKRYEDVANVVTRIDVGDLSVRVLSLEALIEEKRTLGRDKDKAVLRLLEAVLHRRAR